jgi:2-methylisocitrate lyase-like PEP mutase family enzyme
MTGLPDNGTITMTESVTISKWYADALRIPVIVDVDACFGGILQVERAVKEFIHAGVAGIRMEDQPFLGKRFGGMVGKELLPLEEAVAKFRIAVDTRNQLDPDFQIIARCEALTAANSRGLEEAIERLQAYEAAGVDVLWLEGPRSLDELRAIRANTTLPLLCIEYNLPRPLTLDEAAELGMPYVSWPSGPVNRFMRAYYKALLEEGLDAVERFDAMIPTELDITTGDSSYKRSQRRIRELEEKYLPKENLQKYRDSPEGRGIIE